MIKIAQALGRVMMTAVKLPRSNSDKQDGFRKWAETEYRRDSTYVYDCLVNNYPIDMR
jgi:hypothetical protein